MRSYAYRIKMDALLNLRRRFFARTNVASDPRNPSFVIIEYELARTGST